MNHNPVIRTVAALLLALSLAACGGPSGAAPTDPDPEDEAPDDAPRAAAVRAGANFSLALMADGTVRSWGLNTSGQLGTGDARPTTGVRTVTGLSDIVEIAAGDAHALALDSDGDVWAWGFNNRGQIGVGWPGAGLETQLYPTPVQVPVDDIVSVGAASYTSYALDADGVLWAWGDNADDELGDGTAASTGDPQEVPMPFGTPIVRFYAGPELVHAIDDEGDVWLWGSGSLRQGLRDPVGHATPYEVPVGEPLREREVVDLSASRRHVLAVEPDGTVYAWGDNREGQVWLEPEEAGYEVPAPVRVESAPPATTVAAGGAMSIVVSTTGEVWTWGSSPFGELGDGTTGVMRAEPAMLEGLTDVVAVAASDATSDDYGGHALALTDDGRVYAWGYNAEGQLGTGDTNDRSEPVLVRIE